ncbi:MAG: CDP-alcohol phosphatidyltransferase family protein [bacterium]|nr:CDP-alcohol phosphatidyltransferase family protein [bacterium]
MILLRSSFHPNVISSFRVVGVLPLAIMIWSGWYVGAFLFFLGLSATDALDGYIARKYGLITDFGKFWDPTADKILLITTLAMVSFPRFIYEFSTLCILESFLFCMAFVAFSSRFLSKKNWIKLGANCFGKWKVWLEIFLILCFFAEQIALIVLPDYVFVTGFIAAIMLAGLSIGGHLK